MAALRAPIFNHLWPSSPLDALWTMSVRVSVLRVEDTLPLCRPTNR